MGRITLKPTENQNYILLGGEFAKVLDSSRQQEAEGDFDGACRARYYAFQNIVEVLPDDELIELDFAHPNTRAAIELIYSSAIDNFLAGDVEIAAAQLELLLECDGEDHTEATPQLALCYLALEEWDCLNDILPDLNEKGSLRPLVEAIAEYLQHHTISPATLAALRRHRHLCEELSKEEHPADEAYLRDISSERPTSQALAREIYLRCEPLLLQHPDFLAYIAANI